MAITPQIFTGKVMHKRLSPKINTFSYGIYYLAFPLPTPKLPKGIFGSFHPHDVGKRDGSDPLPWIRNILGEYGLNEKTKEILLLTMPRVLGYVFNPVSFYFCLDEHSTLRAVLCEVHNTFGEQHSYLCAHPDHGPITADHWLETPKVFHVSPFLERRGTYKFRFDLGAEKLGLWIDHFEPCGQKHLITSLIGRLRPLTQRNLRRAFWQHPLVPLRAIFLIHWQAIRLLFKGISYVKKPAQCPDKVTSTQGLNRI